MRAGSGNPPPLHPHRHPGPALARSPERAGGNCWCLADPFDGSRAVGGPASRRRKVIVPRIPRRGQGHRGFTLCPSAEPDSEARVQVFPCAHALDAKPAVLQPPSHPRASAVPRLWLLSVALVADGSLTHSKRCLRYFRRRFCAFAVAGRAGGCRRPSHQNRGSQITV